MSYLCQKCKKKLGVTVFVSEIKRVVNYTDLEKLSHIIEHGLRGFIVNNYSPKWRWIAVDIYRAAKRRGKYHPLATDTEVNSCFSIY